MYARRKYSITLSNTNLVSITVTGTWRGFETLSTFCNTHLPGSINVLLTYCGFFAINLALWCYGYYLNIKWLLFYVVYFHKNKRREAKILGFYSKTFNLKEVRLRIARWLSRPRDYASCCPSQCSARKTMLSFPAARCGHRCKMHICTYKRKGFYQNQWEIYVSFWILEL